MGLDNKEYNLNLGMYRREISQCSGPHRACRELIKRVFPMVPVCEEVLLPGSGNLEADFLIPKYKIIIEVHGQQHYKANKHFYKSMADFKKAQMRDIKKQRWCAINNIIYLELDDSKQDGWEQQIRRCYTEN